MSDFKRTIQEAKTKALISCAVTAQLICAFVFGMAKTRFPHCAAQIYLYNVEQNFKSKVRFYSRLAKMDENVGWPGSWLDVDNIIML